MSTFPGRARNYAEGIRSRSGATKSQFGKVGRNIDKESEKPKLPTESFVDRPKFQQQDVPSTSENTRKDMDKIEGDKEKETDSSDFKSQPSPPTTRKTPAATKDAHVTDYSATGAFLKAWTSVDHIVISPVLQPQKSSYTPNFIMAGIILHALEVCLDGNEELKWISPNFFFLPVRVYYSVIFYLQILKAKEAAGKLERNESTWFRAFKRSYPLESLPIVGPLVPYFSNIVSVKPNDDKYDFVYPTFLPNGGLSVAKGIPTVKSEFFLQPNVLLVSDLLRQFCNLTKVELNRKIDDHFVYFDDTDSLIPHRTENGFTFAGIEYPAQLTVATSATLSNPALDKALPETNDRANKIHGYWRKSKCKNIPTPSSNQSYEAIGDMLRMPTDFEWFEECILMAAIQCKFFSDSTNLSQIPNVGGPEALVGCHVTGDEPTYSAALEWYPENWRSLSAQFRTTRADTTSQQFLNAEYALTNATISWTENGHPIGGRRAGQRVGPYWSNREFEYELDHDVPVARRITTVIQSLFYHSYGTAN